MFPTQDSGNAGSRKWLFALGLAAWVIWVNIPPGRLFLFSDLFFPLSHSAEILARYTRTVADWNYPEFSNPRQIMQVGYQGFISLLFFLGFSVELIQKIIFTALLAAGAWAILSITQSVAGLSRSSMPLGLSAVLIYFFNPFAISSFWQRLNLGVFVYALFPLLCWMVSDYFRTGGRVAFLGFLFVFFLITQSSNPVFLASAQLGAIYFGWLLVEQQSMSVCLRRCIAVIFGAISVSLFWCVPFFLSLDSQIAVSSNNLSAGSVSEMRRAIAQEANALNWLAINPFWTGHNRRVVPSADWLVGIRPISMIVVAVLIAGVLAIADERRRRIQVGVLFALVALVFLMFKSDATFTFWDGLDRLVVGLGYRDSFEKLGFLLGFVLALMVPLVATTVRRREFSWIFFSICIAISWPALSGGLFASKVTDPYQQLGAVPSFFRNPDSVKQAIGPNHRIIPLPFFETTLGTRYKVEGGYFTGMTPLYWQNGVQIVAGNNEVAREFEYLLSAAGSDADAKAVARDFHSQLRDHGITAIFWSENVIPEVSELQAFRSQVRVAQSLIQDGCVAIGATAGPYQIFIVKPKCDRGA